MKSTYLLLGICLVLCISIPLESHAAAGDFNTAFNTDGSIVRDVGETDFAGNSIVLSSGKILVASNTFISRYDTDGSLDTTFGTNGSVQYGTANSVPRIALDSNGNILIAYGRAEDAETHIDVQRYDSDGTIDGSFGTSGTASPFGNTGSPSGMAIDSNDAIVLVGNSGLGVGIWRLTSAGIADTSFATDGSTSFLFAEGDSYGNAIAIQSDNKIILGARVDTEDGEFFNSNYGLARLNTDGSLDSNFGTAGRVTRDLGARGDYLSTIELLSDGSILAAGDTDEDIGLIKFDGDGVFDSSFGTSGVTTIDIGSETEDTVSDIAITSDNKIILTGSDFTNGVIMRLDSDGALDTTFGTNGMVVNERSTISDGFTAASITSNDDIFVSGSVTNANFSSDVYLAMFLGDRADLATSVSVDASTPTVGDSVTATITVTNNGPETARNTSASFTVPSGITASSITSTVGTCSGAETLTCTIGSLASAASATITLTASVGSAGTISADWAATSDTADSDSSNSSASLSLTASAAAAASASSGGCALLQKR